MQINDSHADDCYHMHVTHRQWIYTSIMYVQITCRVGILGSLSMF